MQINEPDQTVYDALVFRVNDGKVEFIVSHHNGVKGFETTECALDSGLFETVRRKVSGVCTRRLGLDIAPYSLGESTRGFLEHVFPEDGEDDLVLQIYAENPHFDPIVTKSKVWISFRIKDRDASDILKCSDPHGNYAFWAPEEALFTDGYGNDLLEELGSVKGDISKQILESL
jgi:hypothetical protein